MLKITGESLPLTWPYSVLPPAFAARDDQAAPFTGVAAHLTICSFLPERFPDESLAHDQ